MLIHRLGTEHGNKKQPWFIVNDSLIEISTYGGFPSHPCLIATRKLNWVHGSAGSATIVGISHGHNSMEHFKMFESQGCEHDDVL